MGVFMDHFINRHDVDAERIEHLARLTERALPRDHHGLLEMVWDDHELLLDGIDHLLKYPDFRNQYSFNQVDPDEVAARTKTYFDDARSVYDVCRLRDWEYELVWRQPPELTELVATVASNRSRAAEHLRRAWSRAFARQPDPNDACMEAAKAVEAAARDTIEPNNQRATLGTMLSVMGDKPEKWTTAFESSDARSVETVISMMQMIWKGHLRHGNPDEPLDVSPEQCQMIVHTAALLVYWFTSGRITTAE